MKSDVINKLYRFSHKYRGAGENGRKIYFKDGYIIKDAYPNWTDTYYATTGIILRAQYNGIIDMIDQQISISCYIRFTICNILYNVHNIKHLLYVHLISYKL